MIAWRRDIHENPELGNQEVRTSGLVAKHLKELGYEVREKVATTGIVAVLKGEAGAGPVIALRADMDALPVEEKSDIPFASKARAVWDGDDVPVMHACGHDCHVAILMATAEILANNKANLRGTVKLLFQPAEEKLPKGEIGGAKKMLEEGAFSDPKPDVIFGLHVVSGLAAGTIGYRPGPTSAGSDAFRLTVKGRQTHGSAPWSGVDPIVIASEIVSSMQTLISRETNIVSEPAVLSVGTFKAGTRYNIIPAKAELTGTLRTSTERQRQQMMDRFHDLSTFVAKGMGGEAEIIWEANGYPPVINNENLTMQMAPTLARVAGTENTKLTERGTGGEDFSYFSQVVPGLFFRVGVTAKGQNPKEAPANHSDLFLVDESGLIVGLRAMLQLVADYSGSDVV
ncbi:amidohydrolase [Phyllobacterium sp. P30BS-XVII]|uniref:amidohydrolase n=1 Tax=Phyllobacterium sp. P30BS-XVII TaxID=2587046 RepID=UPI0015FC310C|nr:amidohydrolase [Phyllobacterium sp. P30BS-XVII]MBA8900640.1 amidohydrolase [Phyllobacterium sp. P30BS-XVII]